MNDKTQVLIVMDGMKVGGVENALISVLNHIDYERFDVDLLLLHNDIEMLEYVNHQVSVFILEAGRTDTLSIPFVYYYGLYKIYTKIGIHKKIDNIQRKLQHSSLRQRAKTVLKKQYDVAVGYKQGEPEDFVANCITAKRKIVFYHHGNLIDEKLHEQTYGKVDTVVAISPGVQTMLMDRYPQFAEKIQMIPNYVDCRSIFQKSQQYCIERPSAELVLCTVGRLVSEKRYDLVVETAVQIRKHHGDDFVWYCIGEGDKRKELEGLITKNGLEKQVLLTGTIKNPLPYIHSSDVYVQTSDAESYGLAIQEALVMNKPVVSTKTIGGQLLIKHGQNGYLADMDVSSIYKAICKVMEGNLHILDSTLNYEERDMRIQGQWAELLEKGV